MNDTHRDIDPCEMTPEQAYAEAVRRIEAAAQSGQHWLDLGDLPLEVVPAEIAVLAVQLRELSLGSFGFQKENQNERYDNDRSQYMHPLHAIASIQGLSALEFLDLSSCDQLTNLAPLQSLTALQSLELNNCTELIDIAPLQALAGLRSLKLNGCTQLTDIAPLQALTELQSLDLGGCCELTDLAPLQALATLQLLDLSYCYLLIDFTPLQGLTALQSLNLSGCWLLNYLPPLPGLAVLQSLDLSGCSQLTDLAHLRGLPALQSLDLGGCTQLTHTPSLQELPALKFLDLSGCTQLTDLPPAQELTALIFLDLSRCEQLTSLPSLQGLTSLQSLNLSNCHELTALPPLQGLTELRLLVLRDCWRLTDLPPLQDLTALEFLDMNGCGQLADVTPVLSLSNLIALDLIRSGCTQKLSWVELQQKLTKLKTLHCDRLRDCPAEIMSKDEYDNCLPRLQAWLSDLEQGEADCHDLKLFFLGNGRVGKSELFGRLRGEAFHGKRETTHGIQLDRFELSKHSDGKPIFCNAWDFGGQDIYLGTHALFLKSRALFVLAWHPEMETDAPYTEAVSGLEMRHRPLRYWLDYIHALAGEEARVIVVQTQCATQHDKRRPDLGDTSRFAWIETTVSCAEQDDGVDALRVLLKQAAKHRLEQPAPPRMPASWLAVRDRLVALRATEKTIDRKRFDALCAETHHGTSSAALLHYLHQAGDVFHQDDVFDGAIVLDQQWALGGIYAIFQRDKVLKRLRRQRGRVHADDFDLMVWHERYNQQEQSLLLSMMQRCDLIFRLRGNDDDAQYAMMDALPPADDDTAALPERWRPGPRYGATLHYDFLHEGILRAWIAGIGREANAKAQYWRYGTEFHDTNTRSDAWMQADMLPDGSGLIALLTQGAQAEVLRERLIERFAEIRIGQPPTVEREDPPRASPVHVRRSDEEASGQIVVGPRPRNPGDKPEVYISYAWGGADRPELMAFAEAMHDALQDVFTVYRDKRSMQPGDSIAEFMERIGRGARVLIVLSRSYLNSRYCMQELEHLHARHFGNRGQMRRCIRPLVIDPTLRLDDDDIADYTDYWIGKVARLESRLAGKTPDQHLILRHRLNRYRRIAGATDEMLEFLSDMVMPRGENELSENRFSMVKESLLALPGA